MPLPEALVGWEDGKTLTGVQIPKYQPEEEGRSVCSELPVLRKSPSSLGLAETHGPAGEWASLLGRKGCRCAPVAAGGLGKLEAPSLEGGISCAWFGGGRTCLAFSAWS